MLYDIVYCFYIHLIAVYRINKRYKCLLLRQIFLFQKVFMLLELFHQFGYRLLAELGH